ncbi:ABC transporter substrate-binding protein [Conexibacter sp. CPCC 206217]|uniref:ABC transporter substrate-binding protein n=1 Tax=Conexibacter sp. CPCC 206217 TaxID=3064574 RepID=UPI0027165EF9|nr:ABC transporter substrate-binding protein [Conexibacter sp. CPCC 206217]MDO8211679.1 ABC transporter substrate-binding protein [Conexibacter sp. CPCC 206217]
MSLPTGAVRRLSLLSAMLLAAVLLAACGSSSDDGGGSSSASTAAASTTADSGSGGDSDSAEPVTITVGVPRNFGYLSTLWARDVQPPGVKVEYKYFPVFTDMLTALNGGKIDLTEIGDVGAVQSYVNGGKVKAVAVTQPNDLNCGLIVPRDSTVRTFADLKGKKLAFLRSTNSYISFLHQIKQAGLKESDFQIVEISGPAANKAFQTGQVDAYYTIDPNLADIVQQTGGREIATCRDMRTENLYPYVATTDAIESKPQAIRAVIQAVADNIAWIQAHPDEQARLVAPKVGFSEEAIRATYGEGARGLQTVDDAFYAHEQPVIDELVEARIVSQPVRADEVFLSEFNDATTPSADAAR